MTTDPVVAGSIGCKVLEKLSPHPCVDFEASLPILLGACILTHKSHLQDESAHVDFEASLPILLGACILTHKSHLKTNLLMAVTKVFINVNAACCMVDYHPVGGVIART